MPPPVAEKPRLLFPVHPGAVSIEVVEVPPAAPVTVRGPIVKPCTVPVGRS